jgi:hypothetical protein
MRRQAGQMVGQHGIVWSAQPAVARAVAGPGLGHGQFVHLVHDVDLQAPA